MKSALQRIGLLAVMAATGMGLNAWPVPAQAADAKAICDNELLPYKQRYLCKQQMAVVTTKPEQKKVQQRYSDMVREAQKEKKEHGDK